MATGVVDWFDAEDNLDVADPGCDGDVVHGHTGAASGPGRSRRQLSGHFRHRAGSSAHLQRLSGRPSGAVISGIDALIRDALATPGTIGGDRLHLIAPWAVPEVRLLLAQDSIVLWARLEAEARHTLPAPYWASAWAGGQALARYVLDHPDVVSGLRVLDLASGSGLIAIAAALAGALCVTANDIDPYAMAAITANAQANGVAVTCSSDDLLDGDGDGFDVILAGDVLYTESIAARMTPFLSRADARGARVLVGDPDRGWVCQERLEPVATYTVHADRAPEDSQLDVATVLRLRHR